MDYKQNNTDGDLIVLVYAAGNNDLEYYIYRQFQMIKNSIDAEGINVIVQISKAPRTKQQRNNSMNITEDWNGTRRYVIKNKTAVLVEDLGEINMAKPNTLLDFLIWGTSTFPSKKIILILSGHGAGFVGIMKENTDKGATIMGIQGFSKAIAIFQKITKKKIDILLFDTCFMDTIEILHEIALNSNGAAVYAIIPRNNSLVQGLSYFEILEILKSKNQNELNVDDLMNLLISLDNNYKSNSGLLAVNLLEKNFTALKKSIDSMSKVLIRNSNKFKDILTNSGFYKLDNDFIDLSIVLKSLQSYPDIDGFHNQILEALNRIIINPLLNDTVERSDVGLKLFFPHNSQVYLKYHNLYKQMLFCGDNRWIELIDIVYNNIISKS